MANRLSCWSRPGYGMLPQQSGVPNATCRWTDWPKSWPSPDRFASGPHGGQKQNNLNPTTFQHDDKERKCEKLWTLPRSLESDDGYSLPISLNSEIRHQHPSPPIKPFRGVGQKIALNGASSKQDLHGCVLRKRLFVELDTQARCVGDLKKSLVRRNALNGDRIAQSCTFFDHELGYERVRDGIQKVKCGGNIDVSCESVIYDRQAP